MEKYESMLKLKNYIVNEIYYKINDNFTPSENGTPVNLSIIPDIKTKDNYMQVLLNTVIFANSVENNYPFEMKVSITGEFIVEGDSAEKFVRNAIAILYPYIRSIVSTYTAAANISPLILPVINVNKLIDDQSKNN